MGAVRQFRRIHLKKITASVAVKSVARRALMPRNWGPFLQCFSRRNGNHKAADDAQLRLYSQILPGGFLNYGYHEDTSLSPEKMSLDAIQQAQTRYGERLVDLVGSATGPVLDAGCGMGGLVQLLLQRGFAPTALTPNRAQIHRMRTAFPTVPLIEGRLEQIPLDTYRGHFQTVITSESFQYMNLRSTPGVIDGILRPSGRWILCDYFRIGPTLRSSGHAWSAFTSELDRQGWRIVSAQDITPNVLPTIAYVSMWGQRLAVPLAGFLSDRLERKHPAVHFLFQDLLADLHKYMHEHLEMSDPATFARSKKYMQLVIERRSSRPVKNGNGQP